MFIRKITVFIVVSFITLKSFGQTCAGLGQNPGTAFPVCGTSTFTQQSVPTCGGKAFPTICGTTVLTDVNPYWYKFTCFKPGTLSFVITPNTATEDYDWQLFDITNRNPADIYTDASLIVACNWSGEPGNTGTSTIGTKLRECDGLGVPTFSSMPTLILGHQYLLLVSHFTQTQFGYSLSFSGGTTSITDPVPPHLLSARAACDGTKISVKLNKSMKCSSVNADGSDFILTSSIAKIIGAIGVGCDSSFDMDSVVLTLGSPLPPGNYNITVRPNNNLLDNCDNFIPASDTLSVTVFPLIPTPMDSLSKVGCAPDILQLVFRDPIRCSSIAADGSDFVITGTAPIVITSVTGICNANGLTDVIQVKLSAPIQQAGSFSLQLKTGSDGNSIINECGKETTAGATLLFTTKDTVSALFTATIRYGCLADKVLFSHNGQNGVNSWHWNFDNSITSTAKDTTITFTVFGQKQASLIVSNGTCSDTASAIIDLNNSLKASFEGTSVVCPGDPATFINNSTSSRSLTWEWNFGNGNTSTVQNPPAQFYAASNRTKDIPVQLIVTDDIGCKDTATTTIKVVGNCYIAIPKAFSPNGDGLNDYLYPTNAYKAKDLLFMIYNRGGQKIFETHNWENKWDGTFKGNPQDIGTYVWVLQYTNIETGKRVDLKGTTVLIR